MASRDNGVKFEVFKPQNYFGGPKLQSEVRVQVRMSFSELLGFEYTESDIKRIKKEIFDKIVTRLKNELKITR